MVAITFSNNPKTLRLIYSSKSFNDECTFVSGNQRM